MLLTHNDLFIYLLNVAGLQNLCWGGYIFCDIMVNLSDCATLCTRSSIERYHGTAILIASALPEGIGAVGGGRIHYKKCDAQTFGISFPNNIG